MNLPKQGSQWLHVRCRVPFRLLKVPKESALPEPASIPALPEPVLSSADVTRTLALKEQMIQQVKAEPASSVRVIQAWLQGAAE